MSHHDEEFATDLDHLILAGLVDVDVEPPHEPDSTIRCGLTERGRAESQTSAKPRLDPPLDLRAIGDGDLV